MRRNAIVRVFTNINGYYICNMHRYWIIGNRYGSHGYFPIVSDRGILYRMGVPIQYIERGLLKRNLYLSSTFYSCRADKYGKHYFPVSYYLCSLIKARIIVKLR